MSLPFFDPFRFWAQVVGPPEAFLDCPFVYIKSPYSFLQVSYFVNRVIIHIDPPASNDCDEEDPIPQAYFHPPYRIILEYRCIGNFPPLLSFYVYTRKKGIFETVSASTFTCNPDFAVCTRGFNYIPKPNLKCLPNPEWKRFIPFVERFEDVTGATHNSLLDFFDCLDDYADVIMGTYLDFKPMQLPVLESLVNECSFDLPCVLPGHYVNFYLFYTDGCCEKISKVFPPDPEPLGRYLNIITYYQDELADLFEKVFLPFSATSIILGEDGMLLHNSLNNFTFGCGTGLINLQQKYCPCPPGTTYDPVTKVCVPDQEELPCIPIGMFDIVPC
jgi:hypothetical protein